MKKIRRKHRRKQQEANEKHELRTLCCQHCGKMFTIGYYRLKKSKRLSLLMMFARCPYCGKYRTALGEQTANELHCLECGLPESIVRFVKKNKRCVSCDSRVAYRNQKTKGLRYNKSNGKEERICGQTNRCIRKAT